MNSYKDIFLNKQLKLLLIGCSKTISHSIQLGLKQLLTLMDLFLIIQIYHPISFTVIDRIFKIYFSKLKWFSPKKYSLVCLGFTVCLQHIITTEVNKFLFHITIRFLYT